ncbi:uncharacterized protein LOC135209506 [Macrobrachium nipponense]|uniref:uncharacterized protein LOC135209506 n=1 Tax=Macrobrachium nipponense TaxID=159736 RepID=UPI0030C82283
MTYQDFMREMREFHTRAPSNLPPMAFPPPPPFDPIGPPRYYDGPPLPEYPSSSRSRSEKRPSADPYDRSVDEFLQRTFRDRKRKEVVSVAIVSGDKLSVLLLKCIILL